MSEADEMLSVLCSLFDGVNQAIMKRHRGDGIPSGGWKVVDQSMDFKGPCYLVVMRRDDGKKFNITVEDG